MEALRVFISVLTFSESISIEAICNIFGDQGLKVGESLELREDVRACRAWIDSEIVKSHEDEERFFLSTLGEFSGYITKQTPFYVILGTQDDSDLATGITVLGLEERTFFEQRSILEQGLNAKVLVLKRTSVHAIDQHGTPLPKIVAIRQLNTPDDDEFLPWDADLVFDEGGSLILPADAISESLESSDLALDIRIAFNKGVAFDMGFLGRFGVREDYRIHKTWQEVPDDLLHGMVSRAGFDAPKKYVSLIFADDWRNKVFGVEKDWFGVALRIANFSAHHFQSESSD